MLKFALAMSAYALAMLGIGYLTFISAPPESKAWTALLVPGIGAAAVIACVVMATRINANRKLGMIGIHVGLLLPLLMAAGSFWRLPGSLARNSAYYANQTLKLPSDAGTGGTSVTLSSAAAHPTGYQAVGIGAIGTLSAFAFIAVLLLRPKPPAKSVPVPEVPASPSFTPSNPERERAGSSTDKTTESVR